jgi:hypothetical protein
MKTNETLEELKGVIRYRVCQEYEKYHNDVSFKFNGEDFWIEQIVWKLSETIAHDIKSHETNLLKRVRDEVIGGEEKLMYSRLNRKNKDVETLKVISPRSVPNVYKNRLKATQRTKLDQLSKESL